MLPGMPLSCFTLNGMHALKDSFEGVMSICCLVVAWRSQRDHGRADVDNLIQSDRASVVETGETLERKKDNKRWLRCALGFSLVTAMSYSAAFYPAQASAGAMYFTGYLLPLQTFALSFSQWFYISQVLCTGAVGKRASQRIEQMVREESTDSQALIKCYAREMDLQRNVLEPVRTRVFLQSYVIYLVLCQAYMFFISAAYLFDLDFYGAHVMPSGPCNIWGANGTVATSNGGVVQRWDYIYSIVSGMDKLAMTLALLRAICWNNALRSPDLDSLARLWFHRANAASELWLVTRYTEAEPPLVTVLGVEITFSWSLKLLVTILSSNLVNVFAFLSEQAHVNTS